MIFYLNSIPSRQKKKYIYIYEIYLRSKHLFKKNLLLSKIVKEKKNKFLRMLKLSICV